ncbi:uncharacterized protein LOC112195144 [Rosa chinensis]|uniref:uncharacterized protein LOC112195144 n=1 Tax=Rosa chinensis TaxID=74649 RepID=UPI001AD940FA|nr:uncharacterized protein LOC112195144 [Rosa chinensis]
MDAEPYARCTYMFETIMFILDMKHTFNDIVREVSIGFNHLNLGSFNLRYSFPGYKSCVLSSDMDVKLMFRCMFDFKLNSVDILVRDSNGSTILVPYCGGSSSSTSATTSLDDVSCASSCLSVGSSNMIDASEYLGCYRPEAPKSYLTHEWQGFIRHKDQKFEGGVIEFREKLTKFAIETGFLFKYTRNTSSRVIAECAKRYSDGCQWSIRALKNKVNGFFYIKKLDNVHTCKGVLRQQKSKLLGSHVVKSEIANELKSNPQLKPKEIVSRFKHSFGLDVSYRTAWYGKELARKAVHGHDGDSYSQLLWYRDAILSSNPGSYCILETDPLSNRFERFFICFSGCIEGFKSCIPLLFVDAAHLKSKYKGYMLCATGKNGNQFVDSENHANWDWFFDHLYNILSPQGRNVTFVTDRHSGLLNAVVRVFPDSPHSYCYYHLKENVRGLYRKQSGNYFVDKIVEEFMKVAYSPTLASYNFNLHNLKKEGGPPIEEFLRSLPLEKWCNAFFKGNRYGEMANSIAESFNNWTRDLRELPIFEMFEGLRVKVMENMSERKVASKRWTTILCPPMEALLKKSMDIGRHWAVSMSSETVFEVHSDKSVAVDLGNSTCSCRQWQINSFPCSHALAAIQKVGVEPVYSYIEPFYTCQSYRDSYAHGIHPIPNMEKFYEDAASSTSVVKPPLVRRPSGRPKSVRMKSAAEGGTRRRIKCGRCGELGRHNKLTCTAPI